MSTPILQKIDNGATSRTHLQDTSKYLTNAIEITRAGKGSVVDGKKHYSEEQNSLLEKFYSKPTLK